MSNENEEQFKVPQRKSRGPMGPMGGGMGPAEKAKDFKGSLKKLLSYLRCSLF